MQIDLGKYLCDNVVFIVVDVIMEYFLELCNIILERVVGFVDSDKFVNCIQVYVLFRCYKFFVDQLGVDRYMFF